MRIRKGWKAFLTVALFGFGLSMGCGDNLLPGEDPRDESFMTGGKADVFGVTEGSAEAKAILKVCNESGLDTLKDDVRLPKQARENIYEHPYILETLAELDAISYVGRTAFEKLLEYVRANGLVEGGGGSGGGGGTGGGTCDDGGLTDGSLAVQAILKVCNESSIATLQDAVGLPKRARENIFNSENKPFGTLDELDEVSYVGPTALNKLLAYVRDNNLIDCNGGGGNNGGYVNFAGRIRAFADKYPDRVVLAKRRTVPAIFLKTNDFTEADGETLKEFYKDLYTALGTNSLMLWNVAHSNMGHAAMGLGDNDALDEKYRGKAMTVYDYPTIWDIEWGNMKYRCGDSENGSCFKQEQVNSERTIALVKLSNSQLGEWNTYLNAIEENAYETVGDSEYNGGTPKYFTGEEGSHNCTTWFTAFLAYKVSTDYDIYANPSDFLRFMFGYWGDPEPDRLRGFLIFNNPTTPEDGEYIGSDFEVQYGN